MPGNPSPRRPTQDRPTVFRRTAVFGAIVLTVVAVAGCAAISPSAAATDDTTAVATRAAPTPAGSVAVPRIVPATQSPPLANPPLLPTVTPSGSPTPAPPASTPTQAASSASPSSTPRERLQPNGPPRDPGPFDWAHPGPYVGSGFDPRAIISFQPKQPLVFTYYFYWHDLTDPARQARAKQYFAERPVNQGTYTFSSPATHRKEFEDMQAAGIDVALPVYWGEPGHPGRDFNPTAPHYWSTEGIPAMVAALDQMAAAGHPFKIGMFYDTTILANADLTTPAGKEYFYINVRDYFSRIPPKYWAAIDGKPIVWLYDTQWVAKYDQSSLDYLSDRFAQDFGGRRLFISREWQWYQSKGVGPATTLTSDTIYSWGAAPSGFNADTRLGVAEIGPGFSNTRYCRSGAAANCFDVGRESGGFYERELRAAIRSGRTYLAVETWNEFSEGSDIADTIEFGRTYINLTRRYADMFHGGNTKR